jgi:hypothetical protein
MCNANGKIFPFNPTFISKLDTKNITENPLGDFNINKCGLYDIDIIAGFLAQLSQEVLVHAPVILYEFIPKELKNNIVQKPEGRFIMEQIDNFFLETLKGKVILRTDNESYNKKKTCCTEFRNCLKNEIDKNGDRLCYKLDSRVAFFASKDLNKDNYRQILNPIIEKYNELSSSKEMPDVVLHPKEPIIYYTCPYSSFFEIIFPVFYEKQVIGCVMIGGVCIGGNDYKTIYNNFLSIISKEASEISSEKLNKLQKAIIFDLKKDKEKNQLIIDSYQNDGAEIVKKIKSSKQIDCAYKDSLELIKKHISNFEERYSKRVELLWYSYITQEFNNIKLDFYDKAHSQSSDLRNNKKKFTVKNLSNIIEEKLKYIAYKFFENNDFIRIFGREDFSRTELKLLAASDRDENNKFENFIFDLDKIPSQIINAKKSISNKELFDIIDTKELEKGIRVKLDQGYQDVKIGDDEIIRYYPTLSPKVTFVIWKRYNAENKQIGQYSILKNALLDFYTYIAATYATLWGSQTDKRLEDTIRIARHESHQIMTKIKDSLLTNFDNINRLKEITVNNTLHKKVNDIFIYLDLLRFTLEKSSFLFRKKDLTIVEIDLYDTFNKALNLFRSQIELKGLWLSYPKFEYLSKVALKADKIQFEHVINNLIDNAVKYCYRGTQIVIEVSETDQYNILTVVSYGPKINKLNEIFELYQRDTENVEGEGIGMYLAREIIQAHGGNINAVSTEQSLLNIPCIENYIENKSFFKKSLSFNEIDEIENTIANNYSESNIEDIIAPRAKHGGFRYIPLPTTFLLEYQNKIYKNNFIVKLKK